MHWDDKAEIHFSKIQYPAKDQTQFHERHQELTFAKSLCYLFFLKLNSHQKLRGRHQTILTGSQYQFHVPCRFWQAIHREVFLRKQHSEGYFYFEVFAKIIGQHAMAPACGCLMALSLS